MTDFRETLAPRIVPVVLANVTTRYPYHDAHLFSQADGAFDPAVAHPAFGNSYDWHSSVHSHCTAIRLLTYLARRGEAPARLRAAIAANLTAENVAAEMQYLADHPAFERPYGRAWTLALAAAAGAAPAGLLPALEPLHALAERVANDARLWLETMPGPVRHGVHSNTAFALGVMLDAARELRLEALERCVAGRAGAWYFGDRNYPQSWERSAHDFLSPGLAEADLMRRVLDGDEFGRWWAAFLGAAPAAAEIYAVAAVPNVPDGQIVHLHGLNLSRAGMLARISGALGGDAPELRTRAERLYRAAERVTVDGDYLSTHWLATFAWDAATSLDALP
jgi:Protein of unknown function (DUF2891)